MKLIQWSVALFLCVQAMPAFAGWRAIYNAELRLRYSPQPGVGAYYMGGFTLDQGTLQTPRLTVRQNQNCGSTQPNLLEYANPGEVFFRQVMFDKASNSWNLPEGAVTAATFYVSAKGDGTDGCRMTIDADLDGYPAPDVNWQLVSEFHLDASANAGSQTVGPFAVDKIIKAIRVVIPQACGGAALLSPSFETPLGLISMRMGQDLFQDDFSDRTEFTGGFKTSQLVPMVKNLSLVLQSGKEACTGQIYAVY